MTTKRTPAQTQAEFLSDLSSHLTNNPLLHTVVVHHYGQLQLTWTSRSAHELVTWADTLINVRIKVKWIKDEAFAFIDAKMLGHTVQVWNTVPGLCEELGLSEEDPNREITLDMLRSFAESTSDVAVAW